MGYRSLEDDLLAKMFEISPEQIEAYLVDREWKQENDLGDYLVFISTQGQQHYFPSGRPDAASGTCDWESYAGSVKCTVRTIARLEDRPERDVLKDLRKQQGAPNHA